MWRHLVLTFFPHDEALMSVQFSFNVQCFDLHCQDNVQCNHMLITQANHVSLEPKTVFRQNAKHIFTSHYWLEFDCKIHYYTLAVS